MMTVVLASSSEVRRRLLERAGVRLDVRPSLVDEEEIRLSGLERGLDLSEIAVLLAEIKSRRVSVSCRDVLTVGCDQILEFEGECFTKSKSCEEISRTLKRLRGQTHRLLSAVVVSMNGERIWHRIEVCRLTMRMFSDSFLEGYLERSGASLLSTVGGYKVEELGVQLFTKIEGDLFTVMGLPLLPLLDFLRQRGVLEE